VNWATGLVIIETSCFKSVDHRLAGTEHGHLNAITMMTMMTTSKNPSSSCASGIMAKKSGVGFWGIRKLFKNLVQKCKI